MGESGDSADRLTFVFADLAGFTALTEAHGDERAAELATGFCSRMREVAPRFGGEVIKTIGDAVLILMPRAESAIELSLSILDEEDERAEFPGVRIGMHSGAAIEQGGEWFGRTVNVAARVLAAARAGDVLLTKATYRLARDLEHVEFDRLGARSFKNVSEDVLLFRASRRGAHRGPRDIDPVCRMTIVEGDEVGTLVYEGTVFHFCSLVCAQRFSAEPKRYADLE